MNNLAAILQMLNTIIVVVAFLFVGIYPYIQKKDKSLADQLSVWYKIAQVVVNNEEVKTNKAGSDKKQDAIDTLVSQAKKLKTPVDRKIAAELVQMAYDQKSKSNKDSYQSN